MPDGGALTVTTRFSAPDGSFSVAVADSGGGIPEGQLGEVFTPFFTTKATGTGLGLSVSYGIIQEHGGDIRVQSRPHAGSTFTVTLPLQQPR